MLFLHRIKRRTEIKHICYVVVTLVCNIVHKARVKRKVASGNLVTQLCVGVVRERESESATTASAFFLCVGVSVSICLLVQDS